MTLERTADGADTDAVASGAAIRIDAPGAPPTSLKAAGNLVRAHHVDHLRVRVDDEGVVFAAEATSAAARQALPQLAEQLAALLGSEPRFGDADSLALLDAFPDDESGMDVLLYADEPEPEPEPEPAPAGLLDACFDWRHAQGDRALGALHDVVAPFVGQQRIDDLLVHDLLSGDDTRSRHAAEVLVRHPGPHITAALVERMRQRRGQPPVQAARGIALNELMRLDPHTFLPSLVLEVVCWPDPEHARPALAMAVEQGLVEAPRPSTSPMSTFRGWAPLDPRAEADARGLGDRDWLAEEARLLQGHEGWLRALGSPGEQAEEDARVVLPAAQVDAFLQLLPAQARGEVTHASDGARASLRFALVGVDRFVASNRERMLILAAAALSQGGDRVDVHGPGPWGSVAIKGGRALNIHVPGEHWAMPLHVVRAVDALFRRRIPGLALRERLEEAAREGHL